MRIALIGSEPSQGILYHPTSLAIALKRKRHDVHVVARPSGEQTPGLREELSATGIPVHEIDDLTFSGWRALAHRGELKRLLHDIKPEVVHTFGAVTSMQCRPGPLSHKVVAMVEATGHSWRLQSLGSRLGSLLLNFSADAVCVLCELERRRFERSGLRSRKTHVVHNPIDTQRFLDFAEGAKTAALLESLAIHEDDFLIGYFANFQRRKRHDLLIKAFARILRDYGHERSRLVLAGEGPTKANSSALAEKLGVRSSISFLDRLPNRDVPPLIAACDLVVHCSNAETFGYSMIEPLVLGRSLVAMRTGIAYELERDNVASIVDPDDESQFAEAIIAHIGRSQDAVLNSPSSSLAYVEQNFGTDVIASRLESIYRMVVDDARPTS